MTPKPGDVIKIKVGGVAYDTFIDDKGVQRFKKNSVLDYLVNTGVINLNPLVIMFASDRFTQRDYAEFNMMLGYSVDGFADLSSFQDMEIENPLWNKDK